MTPPDIEFVPETAEHDTAIELLNAEAFGPGRFARAAYKIREGGPHERGLSFVAICDGAVVGSVRLTRIAVGEARALLLGPLAVRPSHRDQGIGRHLVGVAVEAARQAGESAVVLVGDEPYYGPLGFIPIPRGQVSMPRPVDLDRLLVAELLPGNLERMIGPVSHADRAKA